MKLIYRAAIKSQQITVKDVFPMKDDSKTIIFYIKKFLFFKIIDLCCLSPKLKSNIRGMKFDFVSNFNIINCYLRRYLTLRWLVSIDKYIITNHFVLSINHFNFKLPFHTIPTLKYDTVVCTYVLMLSNFSNIYSK